MRGSPRRSRPRPLSEQLSGEYQVTRVRAEEAEREALAEVQLAAAPPRSSPTPMGDAVDPALARTRAEAKLATVRATQAAAVANAADRVAIARVCPSGGERRSEARRPTTSGRGRGGLTSSGA